LHGAGQVGAPRGQAEPSGRTFVALRLDLVNDDGVSGRATILT